MTVKLSELRVSLAVDGGGYAAGMAKKVAADNAGAASSARLGATVTDAYQKISASGSVLERLSRQYVDGYAASARFASGITTLGRAVEAGSIPLERADQILAGLYNKFGLNADAAQLQASGYSQLAALVTKRNSEVAQSSRGAGVAVAMTGQQAALSSYQLTNLGFQLNDVATQAALGQGAFRILAAQIGQFYQILSTGEGGTAGSLRYLGQQLLGLITPARIATAALLAFGLVAATSSSAWASSQRQISNALTGIGGAAGVTVSDINRIGIAAASTGRTTVGAATDMATALAATGKISAETISDVIGLGRSIERTFGLDAAGAADLLARSLADPAKGIDELNKRLGAFDDATSQSVRSLQTQNRMQEAQAVVVGGVKKAIGEATEATTLWSRAWAAVTSQGSVALAALDRGIGRSLGLQDPLDALTEAQSRLDRLMATQGAGQLVGGRAAQRSTGSDVQAQIAEVQRLAEAYAKVADRNEEVRNNVRSIEFGELVRSIDPTLSKLAELESTLRRLDDDMKNPAQRALMTPETLATAQRAVGMLQSQIALKNENLEIARKEYGIASEQLGAARAQHAIELQAISARSPAQQAEIAYLETLNQLRSSGTDMAEAKIQAQMASGHRLREIYQQLSDAARERAYQSRIAIEQGQIENDLIGRSVEISTRLTARFQLLAEAKAEAFRNGTTVSMAEQVRAMSDADELARQAVQRAQRSVSDDLRFETDQAGRTAIEQTVFSRMRSAGLLDNGEIVGAENERIASTIRLNAELERSVEIQKDFAGGFLRDMLAGKSATEALGSAIERLGQKLLDNSIDSLFAGLGKGGALGSTGLISSLFGGAGPTTSGWDAVVVPQFHRGGIVGANDNASQIVHPGVFAGARRYHSGGIAGLKPDEVPAILRRGEEVLTADQRGNRGGGVKVNVSIAIDATGADGAGLARVSAQLSALKANLPKEIIRVVAQAKDRGVV